MFGVVYSKVTGRIRTIYKPDKDSDLDGIRLGDGESQLRFADKQYSDLSTLQDLVSSQTGLIPVNDRYAIVDSRGDVKGAILADPQAGDAVVGARLVANDKAVEGWTYTDASGFTDTRPSTTPTKDGGK